MEHMMFSLVCTFRVVALSAPHLHSCSTAQHSRWQGFGTSDFIFKSRKMHPLWFK